MSIDLRAFTLTLTVCLSGCVTFNDITRPNIDIKNEICADIRITSLRNELISNTVHEEEMDSLSRDKILQVLSTFNINTKCDFNKKKFLVKIHRKTSGLYEGFLGAWSILTVLSVGIIPSYSSFDTDLFVYENTHGQAQSNYSYRAAIWLPFAFKQLRQDTYAFENYHIDARSSVIGTEIAKLIRSVGDCKRRSKKGPFSPE